LASWSVVPWQNHGTQERARSYAASSYPTITEKLWPAIGRAGRARHAPFTDYTLRPADARHPDTFPQGKKRKQAEALSGSEASKHLAAMDEALEILDA
jgi:hypothetical protein